MPKITLKKTPLTHYGKKKTINKFPKARIAEEEKKTCAVCFDDIDMESDSHDKNLTRKERNERAEAHLNCCSHAFHIGCIKKWFDTENTCPLCKKKCTSLTYRKPNRKKKMETITVEDKRQRPDHHADTEDVRTDAYAGWIHMLRQDLEMVTTRAPSDDDADDIDFLAPPDRSAGMFGRSYFFQDIPYQMMYNRIARSVIMTLFVRSVYFRTRLLGLLSHTDDELINSIMRDYSIKAHMIFDVIIRSWLHLRTPYANSTAIGLWIDSAMVTVYGINRHTPASLAEPISIVDTDNETRPWHPRLSSFSFDVTRNEFIVEAYASAEGREINDTLAGQGSDESFDDYFDRIYII